LPVASQSPASGEAANALAPDAIDPSASATSELWSTLTAESDPHPTFRRAIGGPYSSGQEETLTSVAACRR